MREALDIRFDSDQQEQSHDTMPDATRGVNGVRVAAKASRLRARLADEYWGSGERVSRHLAQIDALPHRREAEEVLLDHLPLGRQRVLDLGAGDGRLIDKVRAVRPEAVCVGVDYSEPMLAAARERFAHDDVLFIGHDLASPLPDLGKFDAVVSTFVTHNLRPDGQRALYENVFEQLVPGGVFCNLDHVASPTPRLHDAFYRRIALMTEFDHRLHTTVDLAEHLRWLRELEFDDVDCYWKWLELALIVGVRAG